MLIVKMSMAVLHFISQ